VIPSRSFSLRENVPLQCEFLKDTLHENERLSETESKAKLCAAMLTMFVASGDGIKLAPDEAIS
jgi:hypothetical protein